MKSMLKPTNWSSCGTWPSLGLAAGVWLLALAGVQAQPVIATDLQDQTVGAGSNCTFAVTSTNTDAAYQWFFNATNALASTTNRYTVTSAQASDAGTYSVVLSNATGSVTSRLATLTVLAAPAITTQPVASTILATNTPLTLWVVATGDNLSYQWYKGSSALSGQTATNLVFNSLAASDAATYTVKVTNQVGKVTSANAVVTPVVLPSITTQPAGKGLAVSSNYTMSVSASGLYLHYYWFQNATNPVGSDTNKLQIVSADPTNAGTYSVIVSNLAGQVTSSNALITVEVPPTITTQPVASTIQVTNTPLTLWVVATGDNLSYQWYKGSSALSGQTATNLIFNNLVATNAGTYTVVVSNRAAKVTSANAVVIPVVLPNITTQPVGKGLAVSSNYTMSVSASGLYLHYYWFQNATNPVGSDTNNFQIVSADPTNAGLYSVIVSNLAGQVTSSNASISVEVPPTITTPPVTSTIQVTNTPLTLWVVATGDNLSYQWYKGSSALSGQTATNLIFNNLVATNAGTYTVVVSNRAAKVTSANAVVTPVVLPSITTQPVGKGLAVSSNYTMSVSASGLYLHYYWFQNATNPVGSDTNSFSIISADPTNAGTYSVIVSNLAGQVTSSNALITVEVPPTITTQPVASTIQATNTALTLWVVATGDNLSYQWYKGSSALSGQTATNLIFNNLVATNAGTYTVVVSNRAAKVTSANAVVVPVSKPIITAQPVGKGLIESSNYTMSVTASGLYLHYYWFQNATNPVGADTNNFQIVSADPTNAGLYSVIVSNLAGQVTSSNATITVELGPKITTQPAASTIQVTNTPLTLWVVATGDNLSYQWYKGSTALRGQTATNLVFTNLVATNAGTYSVVVSNHATKVTSANAVVIPVVLPSITTQPTGKGLAVSSNYTMSVTASGLYLHYYWFQNATNPVGADTNHFQIVSADPTNAGLYSVIVSNLAGQVTRSNASVSVEVPPTITTQPVASTIQATNTPLTLWTVATGDNLSYQWYKNKAALTGQTATNLVFTNLLASHAGTYTVVVSNRAAKVTSTNAVVIPVSKPVITFNPWGKGLMAGSNYTMTVTATGLYLHYYWFQNVTNPVGADTNKFQIVSADLTNAGYYTVVVSNLAGSVTSIRTLITVEVPPKITTQPVASTIQATNTPLTLWVAATGDNLSYQWYKNKAALQGQTATNLVFTNLVASQAGTYTVVITNSSASVTSTNAVVIPVIQPAITAQPATKGLALGSNYTMSVTASGLYLHYYWFQNATNPVGADTNKFQFVSADPTNAGLYSVTVSNLAGQVTSSNALITVEALPHITTQPAPLSLRATNNPLTLWVVATGDNLSYQWYKGSTALRGQTATNLVFTNLSVTNAGTYTVVITNHAAKVTSANAVVTVVPAPTLSASPNQFSVLQGASATLKVTATSSSAMGFQWSFFGTNDLPGATNLSLTITNMDSTQAGIYQLTATNFAGASFTNITVKYLADTNPPVVSLTGAGAFFTNAAITLSGKATDNVRVTNVMFSVDAGTNFTSAVTTNGWTNFVLNATLPSIGTNLLLVKAADVNGNWSALQTNWPVYAPLYSVAITTVGQGAVATNWSGKVQWGKSYTLTAQAAPYNILSGWSGDVTTNAVSWSFLCQSNLAVTATFVTNIFIGADGTYNGLVTPTTSLTATNFEASCGYLTITITTNLAYSGKLYLQGTNVSLSGSFTTDGTLTKNITVFSNTYSLSLNFSQSVQLWSGTFSDNATWTNIVSIDRAAYSAKNPAPFYGSYTMALPTEPGVGMGTGYGAVSFTVSSNGTITASGTTADGTPWTQSSFLSQTGYWPLYSALYPNSKKVCQGMVLGWIEFASSGQHLPSLQTDLVWLRPDANGVLSDSYTNTLDTSVFVAPAAGHRVLTNQLATITFSGAGLTNSYSEIMVFSNDGTVTTDGSAHLSVANNGLISGTMLDPATGLTNKVSGVVFQNLSGTLGKGSVVGPSSIGNFVITPYP